MKPFDYPERMRLLREGVDAQLASFIFRSNLPYGQIAILFSCPVDKIKLIAEKAGIRRGRGWRPKV